MSTVEIKVPDIGDFKDVPIVEVFVKPGDAVKPEDPLIALESDKATMDVPSPAAGTVKDLKVKVGDRVSQGKVILLLDAAGDGKGAAAPSGGNGQSAASAQLAAPATKPPPAQARRRGGPGSDGWRLPRLEPLALAASRFHQVWAGRDQTALAHQEDRRRESRSQLGDDPARHAVRRGGHHRSRGAARPAQQGEREGG